MSMARVDPIRTEPASTVQPAGRWTRDRALRLDESIRMSSTHSYVLDGVGMIRGAAAQIPNLRFAGAEHAMRTTLINPADEAHLDRFGFAVVDFLDERLIEELSAVHDEIGEAPDDPGMALYFGFHSKSTDYKWRAHNRLSEMLAAKAAETFDRHDIYLAIFITKWPGPNSGFGPHQDPTLLDERSFRGVTLWAPLTATGRSESGIDNGMLHVVPGSHRFAQYARVRDVNQWIYADVESEILTKHGVGIPTRPGEAIVFDDRLIHYSAPNATDTPRVVVSLGVRPQETTCVLVRANDAGSMSLYEVEDASFIDVTASAQHLWLPDGEPIATLDPPPAQMSAADFAAHCEAVERPACVVEPTRIEPSAGKVSVDPDLFCAFCGATEDLVDPDRSGKGKAQLQCRSCRNERELALTTPLPEVGYTIAKPISPAALDRCRALAAAHSGVMNAPYWSSNVHASRAEAGAIDAELTEVIGNELAAALPGYRPFIGALIAKCAAEGSYVDIHQDWTYTDERTHRCVLAWIPLTDVDEHNGGLFVIDHSHRWTDGIRPGDTFVESPTSGIQEELWAMAEPVALAAGQPLLYDPALLHGSTPNGSDALRVAVAVGFAPIGADLVHFQHDESGTLHGFAIDASYFTADPYRSVPHDCAPVTPWARTVSERDVIRAATSHPTSSASNAAEPEGPIVQPDKTSGAAGQRATSRADGRVVASKTLDRRLRIDGFVKFKLLDDAIALRLRRWFLEHHQSGTGFHADLTSTDVAYRMAVRDEAAPAVADAIRHWFPGYEPFLYNYVVKWPGEHSELYLHQDWMYVDERKGASTFVVWIPLQDVTGHNGQIQVLRGSHLFDRSLRGTDLTADWVDDDDLVRPHLEAVPAETGEAVVMNNALVHCSYPNNTEEPRAVLAVGIKPIGEPLVYFRRHDDSTAYRYNIDAEFLYRYTPAQLHAEPPVGLRPSEHILRIDGGTSPQTIRSLLTTRDSMGHRIRRMLERFR